MKDDVCCMYKFTDKESLQRYVSTWVPYIVVYPFCGIPKIVCPDPVHHLHDFILTVLTDGEPQYNFVSNEPH